MTAGPANAGDVQAIVEERLAALRTNDGTRETVTVEFRGHQTHLPVIDMPISLLKYNPDTHRIRAQRTLEPAREETLQSDPYGDSAQQYLHHLLMGEPEDPTREDPTFTALKDDLAVHGQAEPGIIRRSGVLINGNTRCAALNELSREHIRVGILPPDAGDDDFQAIELALQLRKDHKRDYSFVNKLLAIDERIAAGRPTAEVARDFRVREITLDRLTWILDLIREAIERSRQAAGDGAVTQLRLVDFESHQGKLEELHRAYATLKRQDSEAADALREQRLLALVLGKSKTDLRLIESDFAAVYLPTQVPQAEPTAPSSTIPGTSIPAPQQSESLQQLQALTDKALRAKAVVVAGSKAKAAAAEAASRHIQDLTEAVDGALDKAGKNARIKKRQVAPAERISDAVEDLGLAVQAIAEARARAGFDTDDVEDALSSMRGAVEKLAQQVNLSREDDCGDGVEWLLRAAVVDVGD